MAILLRDRLTASGYRVFLDVESLNSGSFNKELLSVIEACTDFVIVCSKNSLDRCVNEDDWVRIEIACALENGKNIVPVMLRGFEWPSVLPDDIDALRIQNGVNANSNEYFDAAIDRLTKKFLKSAPRDSIVKAPFAKKTKGALAAASLVVLAALIVGGIAFWMKTESPLPNDSDTFEAGENIKNVNEDISLSEAAATPVQTTSPPPEPKIDHITIKGNQYNTSLFELDLSNMNLANTDIVPLRHMTNLEVLSLGGNQISDLTPLSNLVSLTELSLHDNVRISDLTPLSNLTKLTILNLYFNQISNLTPLSGLANLEQLVLNGNQIIDLKPLSVLAKLESLSLSENRISDLSPLSGLTNLNVLSLSLNQINDLTPLAGLTKLTRLNLHKNQINDLKPLSGLTNLSHLSLSENQIDDWSPVEHVSAILR